ncbi:Spo0B domain-containing protein [Sediminibacillus albus]|uniref:Stage 0 sporulation protein B (Sporulation initiation phosphotransferase) n=1 Tax=Sediminibacillus albus TaxID=407036 RepID=A0A1G9BM67_9BACI|nr:Spo0B domain-containing protein [Sediminibacillus albus]SDK40586.1 stage 0 sporulation protein B (sporulation initiation phosphotransferase) [Sediminibacillus albus]
MRSEEVVNLLSHYRHDWMNELQLLTGYASMGKLDKVQDKIQQISMAMEKERRISNAGLPRTALWAISFNWNYSNFRLDYQIYLEKNQHTVYDEQIVSRLQTITDLLEAHSNSMELYEGELTLRCGKEDANSIEVQLLFTGAFENPVEMEEKLSDMSDLYKISILSTDEEKNQCTVKWTCS